MPTPLRWRPMAAGDLASVAEIASIAFPDHHEDPACFAERLALSPSWCLALDDGTGPLQGYLIAYPWCVGTVPPLNAPLGRLPDPGTALFLHDLAIRREAAGSGQARIVVEALVEQARAAGLDDIALVAVNDTAAFWRHHGFVLAETSPLLRDKLASYGEGARYMRRRLQPTPSARGGASPPERRGQS